MSKNKGVRANNDKYIYELLKDPNYKVSFTGTVEFFDGKTWVDARFVDGKTHKRLHFSISYTFENKNYTLRVGRIILAKYSIEKLDPMKMAIHIDDNPLNDHIDNLFHGTRSDNMINMFKTKRTFKKRRYVTEEIADGVRKDRAAKMSYMDLAKKYDISRTSVVNILCDTSANVWYRQPKKEESCA